MSEEQRNGAVLPFVRADRPRPAVDPLARLREAVALETITRLLDAGAEIIVHTTWGETYLEPEELLEWCADPDAYWAREAGVTVEELRAFEAARGELPCPAITRHGRPCQNIAGRVDTAQEWVRRRGEPCLTHRPRRPRCS